MIELSLYQAIMVQGLYIDHHESDLYVKDTPTARAILKEYPDYSKNWKRFKSPIDGEWWIDVPFAYDPFWNKSEEAMR